MLTARAGPRTTRRWLVAAIGVALLVAVVVLDLVRKPTPHPFEDDWHYSDGRVVPNNDPFVLSVYRGHEHCDWEEAVFAEMSWPPGTEVNPPISVGGPDVRQFVRDPEAAVDEALADNFDPSATLPEDAEPTGFERGAWRIFVSESTADRFIYLVSDEGVERWPSSELATNYGGQRLILCA